MPSATILSEKQKFVADLAEQLAGKVPLLFPVHIYGKSEWKISEERKSFFHQLT